MSVPTVQGLIEQALDSVPADGNPYLYVATTLSAAPVTGDAAPSVFIGNMSAILALYTLSFIACIFTLIVKYKHGSLWLFRWRTTQQGKLLTVNTTALFTFWSICYVVSASLYIGLLIAAQKRVISSLPAQSIMCIIWIPMCLSLFTEGHGMAVAVYLSQPNQTFFGVCVPAFVLNTVALAFYCLMPVALIPYFALAANATDRSITHTKHFISWLLTQAAQWNGSSPFTLDAHGSSELHALSEAGTDYPKYLSSGFKVFLFCSLASAMVFLPGCIGYLRLLGRQLKGHRSLHWNEKPSSGEKQFINSNSSKQSDRLEALAISYRLMLVEVVCILFCFLVSLGLTMWGGFWLNSIMAEGHRVIGQHVSFYYVFAFFETPVCFLIAYRSWKAYQTEGGNSRQSFGSPPLNRSIEVTTTVHHDVDDDRKGVVQAGGKPFLETDSVSDASLTDFAGNREYSQV